MRLFRAWSRLAWVVVLLCGCAAGALSSTEEPQDPAALNDEALSQHRLRRLHEASALYAQVLAADAPRAPTEAERELALRLAPRLFATPGEPFALRDVAAILHPEQPIIGYHLLWEDDIDFPDDNDPCDHELIWVTYDPASGEATAVQAYYHGQILSPDAALSDAQVHGGRPWIGVQWGRHGSLPWGWELWRNGQVWRDMQDGYEQLHSEGRRLPDHPLARGWPRTFAGGWEEFVAFSQPIEIVERLAAEEMILVSRWPNAVLDQHLLRYNFYPKTEWPE